MTALAGRASDTASPARQAGARRLTIGLLNNMPDAALCATERQFADLLTEAAGGTEIELKLYALPGVRRGAEARAIMNARYESVARLAGAGLDGLIVTGLEPRAADLRDEPYWPALARLIDWTADAGPPTVWSCLAAHAAVLRLDRVRRRPLAAKLSGVFASEAVSDDPLVAGAGSPILAPHSRLNGLAADDLLQAGYEILTRSPAAGVDAFARRGRGVSLFLQGHPEYDAGALAREYLRDVGRFLDGRRSHHPRPPTGYFDAATEARLGALAAASQAAPDAARLPLYAAVLEHTKPPHTWRASAVRLYRNWLAEATERAGATNRADRGFGGPAA